MSRGRMTGAIIPRNRREAAIEMCGSRRVGRERGMAEQDDDVHVRRSARRNGRREAALGLASAYHSNLGSHATTRTRVSCGICHFAPLGGEESPVGHIGARVHMFVVSFYV